MIATMAPISLRKKVCSMLTCDDDEIRERSNFNLVI
jgi:hypothetical protein